MSEITPLSRDDLYRELGLEHLLPAPELTEVDDLRMESKGAARTAATFQSFFEVRDRPDSPAKGYSEVAAKFIKQLGDMSFDVLEWSTPISSRYAIELRPPTITPNTNDGSLTEEQARYLEDDTTILYEADMTPASKLFISAIDYLLHAQYRESRQTGAGETVYYYAARYHRPPLTDLGELKGRDINFYLAETQGEDEKGAYTALALVGRIPREAIERKPLALVENTVAAEIRGIPEVASDDDEDSHGPRLPKQPDELIPYFRRAEVQDPEKFRGMGDCANELFQSLYSLANTDTQTIITVGNKTTPLKLAPEGINGGVLPASEALLAAAYSITNAKITDAHEVQLDGRQLSHVIYEGKFPLKRKDNIVSVPVAFKETYVKNSDGICVSVRWSARTNYPQREQIDRKKISDEPSETDPEERLINWGVALEAALAQIKEVPEPDYQRPEAA